MADRHPPPSRAVTSGISKARSGMSSTTSQSVRRNLFQSQLTRRPTATTSTPGDALHQDPHEQREHQYHSQFQAQRRETASPPGDIVVRDKNGEIELGDPPTPPVDDADEIGALDARHENEMERQRLSEAVKQHQIDQNSVLAQPEGKDPTTGNHSARYLSPVPLTKTTHFATDTELLEAVKASLKAKVAALAEDNWMFEQEELPHQE